jgi:hypothetical protein
MAEHTLYIDCDRAVPVTSATDSTRKALPTFVQGDTIHLKLYLLQGYSRASSYTKNAVSGITIQAALGPRLGNSSELYTAAYSWTASTEDLSDPFWEATLPMNTDEIDDLLGSAGSAQAYFEIKYFRDALPTTCLSELVTIYAAVIKEESVVPVAEPTPLSAEVAAATYQRLDQLILPTYAYDQDSGKTVRLYIDDDGAFHADPEP